MTAIRIDNFGGKAPRRSDRLLPESFAVVAENTNLTSGELRGFNQLKEVQDFTADVDDVNSVFRLPAEPGFAVTWVRFSELGVNFHKGPLVNDAFSRYYWTGEEAYPEYNTRARIISGDDPFKLGVLAPVTAPTLVVTGGGPTTVTRSYVYTFVSAYGEEGPPSPPKLLSDIEEGSWDLSDLETTMADIADRNITHKNIYRTVQGQSTTAFYFVAQVTLATTTYSDTEIDSTIVLNNQLESEGWIEPPADMIGLTVMPNGIMAGFDDRNLYFSEPYRPHAWPADNTLSVDFPVIGLGVIGSSLIACTTSAPYVISGVTPSALTLNKLDTIEPCLSKRSVVSTQEGVYYASKNGYVLVTPGAANLVTRPLLTEDQWNSLYSPGTIHAARYGTRILGFDALQRGFIFDYNEPNTALVSLVEARQSLTLLTGVSTDRASGSVYFLIGKVVFEFNPLSATGQQYRWKSKVFDLPNAVNMAAGLIKVETRNLASPELIAALEVYNASLIAAGSLSPVDAIAVNGSFRRVEPDPSLSIPPRLPAGGSPVVPVNTSGLTGTVEVTVWGDGVQVMSRQVTRNEPFRIPSKRQAHTWQIQVVTDLPVFSMAIATTRKELRLV